MKQSIVCGVCPKSENKIRALQPLHRAGYTKGLRSKTARLLTNFKPAGAPPYICTMTRISAGHLDSDGVVGAFKPVRDEIAAWVGLDDDDQRFDWRYDQAPARLTESGMRITIEDSNAGDAREIRVPGAPGDPLELAPGTLTAQLRLPTRPCYILLPWDQEPGQKARYSRLATFDADPPELINIVVPTRATRSGAWRPGEQILFQRTYGKRNGVSVTLFKHGG